MVRIVGHKAQQKSGSSAHIPEKLQLGAPISTEFPGGQSARVAARNTLKDLQIVVTATVKSTETYLLVETGRNDSLCNTKEITIHSGICLKVKGEEVKQSRYRPGVAQRIPGS
jgi:hypothetical protein